MNRTLIKSFWDCGDSQIIEFAIARARLNAQEKEVIKLTLDDCKTQEQAAEILDISVRKLQDTWKKAVDKMLAIPWVRAYAEAIENGNR